MKAIKRLKTSVNSLKLVKVAAAAILTTVFLPINSNLAAAETVSTSKHLEPLPAKGSAEKPMVLLEAEPLDGKAAADPAVSLYGGKVISNDGESCSTKDSSVVLVKNGHAMTKIVFSYSFEPKPGTYHVWTSLQTGSIGSQNFTVKAGESSDKLVDRLSFQQAIEAPWTSAWRKADGTLTILPSDKVLVIETSGMATQAKVFDAFLLVPAEKDNK